MNENSLKRLNGYLENLQKPGRRSVQPLKLTFYIRDTKDSSDVQPELLPSGTGSSTFLINLGRVFDFKDVKPFVPVCRFQDSKFHSAHQ